MLTWAIIKPAALAKLPSLYSTEKVASGEERPVIKFFTPFSNWTWFAFEAGVVTKDTSGLRRELDYPTYLLLQKRGEVTEIEDVYFFGYVHGFEGELGYFALSELESVKGPLGMPIERDRYCAERMSLDSIKQRFA